MTEILNIGTIPTIEVEIYQAEEAFFPDQKIRETLQKELITKSFKYHYQNNDIYRDFCDKKNIAINDVVISQKNIPLMPSTVFKTMNIRTNSKERTIKSCLSSGTQGSVSVIERDNTTLERFLGSIRNVLDNVCFIDDAIIFNLGSSSEEAKDIWFSYVMGISDLVFPTIDYVVNDIFLIDKLIKDLKRHKNNYQDILIIGAPIMFLELYKYFKVNNIKFESCSNFFVITAGGWKKFIGDSVSRTDFNSYCKKMFIGLKDTRIRDVFNMVELNTILPECECGSKHIPVWLDIYPINLDTYQPCEIGEMGLLGFIDASPTSYPGFVMSGDLGKITYVDNCPCGKTGLCLEVIRRINTIESRGCALKIEKNTIVSKDK